MDQLPSSIEAYLEEAGFSGTEILILRRLMDGEPLTIRQLGAKTGKSTGVLDQAMKKLMKKNIIKKTLINETPKYSLDSLESVVEWMQDDMEQKRDMLLRRHQNFESFVTSLESGNKRPDIEYFEGESGIKQAYIKLLNGPGEIFHYLPVTGKEEEDPLRDFRVQYFRERQNRKMFSRILAHDNALGRRYQSRDAFEYRKTVLVPEAEYPFTFEKIITGDRIACFDHKAKTACVIRYPELADIEKTLFEAIWRQVQQNISKIGQDIGPSTPEKISLSTQTLSRTREFFLSKKSWGAVIVSFVFAALITASFAAYNKSQAVDRIRDTVMAVAATAALKISSEDVEMVRELKDVNKPEYRRLVEYLFNIKSQNKRIKYAYVIRPRDNSNVFEFVADAEAFAIDESQIIDLDGNGIIDDADEVALPGVQYDVSHISILAHREFSEPISSDEPYSDQWGTFYSGYAPIRSNNGEIVAIAAIDMDASELNDFGPNFITLLISFVVLFCTFLVARMLAFNKLILWELFNVACTRAFVLASSFVIIICISAFFVFYWQSQKEEERILGEKLMAIAATAAAQFEPEDIEQLQFARDMKTETYQKVFRKLKEIRDANTEIKWAYILRPTTEENVWVFVADADSNYFLQESNDYNLDDIHSSDEINVWPGMAYFYDGGALSKALVAPAFSETPETDQWGTFITGAAPIVNNGKTVAVVGFDVLLR